jgi:hypothetical protein
MLRTKTFQYFSDLHLERCYRVPLFTQIADHLILAGDIGHPQCELYQDFIQRCAKQYEHVFMVYGNHEWDRGSPVPYQAKLPVNVHLLENRVYTVVERRLSILGCTLWTPFVRKRENAQSVEFLCQHLQEREDPEHRVICVTHHLPSYKMIVEKYHARTKAHPRFANHLDHLMKGAWAPQYWICGHSHSIVSKQIGQTRCLINTYAEKHNSKFSILL